MNTMHCVAVRTPTGPAPSGQHQREYVAMDSALFVLHDTKQPIHHDGFNSLELELPTTLCSCREEHNDKYHSFCNPNITYAVVLKLKHMTEH